MAALALPLALSVGSSIFKGILGGSAAKKQAEANQKAADFLKGQETTGLQNYQPYLSAGSGATNTLSSLLGVPGQGLLQNWNQKFTAPTAAEAEATPGYQFQLKAGEDAIQNSAAGRGSLLTGRTLADLNNFAQGTASTNYQNTFNNAFTQYGSAYNTFLNNQNNQYSRLMGMSNEGLNATQGAGQFMSGMAGDIASMIAGKGAAQAAGKNAIGAGIGGAMSNLGSGLMLNHLMGSGGSDAMMVNQSSTNPYTTLLNNSNNPTAGVVTPFPGMPVGAIPGAGPGFNLAQLGM